MFSLLVTIISIALVAALALATLYYGGSSFQKGNSDAKAAEYINAGQQIIGAADLFRVSNARWPTGLDELLSSGYLTAIPADVQAFAPVKQEGFGFGISSAMAADDTSAAAGTVAGWTTVAESRPTYQTAASTVVSDDLCQSVNAKTIGQRGILNKVYGSATTQCWHSSSAGQNFVVVSRDGDSMSEILPADEIAPAGSALPTADDTDAWYVAPTDDATKTPTTPAKDDSGAKISLSSSSIQFGSIAAGVIAYGQSITVTNLTDNYLSMSGSSNLTFDNDVFTYTDGESRSECHGSLAPNASCVIALKFWPQQAIGYTGIGTITVVTENDDLTETVEPHTFAVSGTGTNDVTLATMSLDAGHQQAYYSGGSGAQPVVTNVNAPQMVVVETTVVNNLGYQVLLNVEMNTQNVMDTTGTCMQYIEDATLFFPAGASCTLRYSMASGDYVEISGRQSATKYDYDGYAIQFAN